MPGFEVATAAHFAGSIVLALFFVLLERHDPRSYLRDWMAAWIAQVLALATLLAASRWDAPGAFALYLFLVSCHGVLLVHAARSYAGSPFSAWGRAYTLVPLLVWAAVAPRLLADDRRLQIAQLGVVAATYVIAALALWPLRRAHGMGLRLTANVLALLGVLYGVHACLLALRATGEAGLPGTLEAAPFVVLLLQMLLALGMVLTVMEATQWALSTTNAQLREAEHRLKVLAETDPLTGCFNRRVFRDLVDDLRAAGGARSGVILVIDMDGLKELNDREGHTAGDQAIRSVAEAIRTRTRLTDLVVRYGGDEFVVVLPGVSEAEGEQRQRQIGQAVREAGFSASSGRAVYGTDVDIMAAVDKADERMYEAKAERKKRPATP